MTTIAYRDGVLAGDTLVTSPRDIKFGERIKVFKSPSGWLGGVAGPIGGISVLEQWMRQDDIDPDKPPVTDNRVEGLVISPKGEIYFWCGKNLSWMSAKFTAVGSGDEVAMGAMAMGATAVEAVEVGIRLDAGSGGFPVSVKLDGVD